MRLTVGAAAGFTLWRYLGFALLAVRGIVLARLLGPALFGVWGFQTLVLQYLSYSSVGVYQALNVLLARGADDTTHRAAVFRTATGVTALVVVFLLAAGIVIHFALPDALERYRVAEFAIPVAAIAAFSHVQQLGATVCRVDGRLGVIALVEFVTTAVPLVVLPFFTGEGLIEAYLVAWAATALVGIGIYATAIPYSWIPLMDLPGIRAIVALGLSLVVYQLSYYGITVAARTVVGIGYSNTTMGIYSLANTLSGAALLGLNAISWVIFPGLVRLFSSGSESAVASDVERFRALHQVGVATIILSVAALSRVLFIVLPSFEAAGSVVTILLAAQGIQVGSFAFSALAIAHDRQLAVARYGAAGIAGTVSIAVLAAATGHGIEWIAVGAVFGSTIFAFGASRVASGIARRDRPTGMLDRFGGIASVLAYGSCVVGGLVGWGTTGAVLGLGLLIARRQASLRRLFRVLRGADWRVVDA